MVRVRRFSVAWTHVHNLQYFPVMSASAAVDPAAVIVYARNGWFGAAQQENASFW